MVYFLYDNDTNKHKYSSNNNNNENHNNNNIQSNSEHFLNSYDTPAFFFVMLKPFIRTRISLHASVLQQ